ncbi:MAG TPA: hypothetical protein VEP66_15015 [Myxococcales bacterium]|nr:hypothetical protein [Myxococcales bacterium]
MTALMLAAMLDRVELVQLLLERGASKSPGARRRLDGVLVGCGTGRATRRTALAAVLWRPGAAARMKLPRPVGASTIVGVASS